MLISRGSLTWTFSVCLSWRINFISSTIIFIIWVEQSSIRLGRVLNVTPMYIADRTVFHRLVCFHPTRRFNYCLSFPFFKPKLFVLFLATSFGLDDDCQVHTHQPLKSFPSPPTFLSLVFITRDNWKRVGYESCLKRDSLCLLSEKRN